MDELEPKVESEREETVLDKAARAGKALGLPGQLTVRRTSGELDSGWLVLTPDNQGRVVVIKEIDGQLYEKTVSLDEAHQLNPLAPETEVITGIPEELGGQAIRQEVLADEQAHKEHQENHPVQGVHTDIVSGRVQGHTYMADTAMEPQTGPQPE